MAAYIVTPSNALKLSRCNKQPTPTLPPQRWLVVCVCMQQSHHHCAISNITVIINYHSKLLHSASALGQRKQEQFMGYRTGRCGTKSKKKRFGYSFLKHL
ncbi:unnamed protein product [Ceratitis capitata]|uniref:(Mediterranean fruit fly) hypothetical protein n=1 Tax=Ceratitis capitata TaxID=7213 RepID=A0A811UIJ6_CERCA|nr:unnamed protein product [Ceratitis capitata]